jgi:hypothetical protein
MAAEEVWRGNFANNMKGRILEIFICNRHNSLFEQYQHPPEPNSTVLRTEVELPFERWEQTDRPAQFKNSDDY